MVELFAQKREAVMAAALKTMVHLVRYEPGAIEFRSASGAPADLAPRMSRLLGEWTGRAWLVSLSREVGTATLAEQYLEAETKRRQDAANHPLVQAVLLAFPGATIEVVRDLIAESEDGPAEAMFTDSDAVMGEEE